MENEIRFYHSLKDYEILKEKLLKISSLNFAGRNYEKTSQFNHPMPKYDFYSKEIDGRFRVRITKGETSSKCKISWKRRIKNKSNALINQEEEVELSILENEYENLTFLLNNVLHLEEVECYERYRTVFENEDVEIVLDEYPFGLALEIEAKNNGKYPETIIDKYVNLLNLDYTKRYPLSWDDKYLELCTQQGFEGYKFVLFNKPMPKI